MDVKICAFALKPGNGISLSDFFTARATKGLHTVEDALIAVSVEGTKVHGVLLSPKNAKAFCTLTKTGAKIDIKAEDLAAGKTIADFNFFLFDLEKGFGLYQSYFRAAPLGDFFAYLRLAWKAHKEATLSAAGVTVENAMTKDSVNRRRALKGVIDGAVVFRAHTFAEKIDLLTSVNRMTFSFQGAEAIGGEFSPFGANLKAASVNVSFVQNANWQQVKTHVKALAGKNPKAATVFGKDSDGNEIMYRLFHDVDVVEILDFDTITKDLHIDSNNIAATMSASPLIQALTNLHARPDIQLLFQVGHRQ